MNSQMIDKESNNLIEDQNKLKESISSQQS